MAADVLTFDASRRRILKQGGVAGAGEILMFSGVRYTRGGEPSPAAADETPLEPAGPNPQERM